MARKTALTQLQRGALEQVDMRGYLPDHGWGGYGRRTLRSLERRGLLRETRGRFVFTDAGRAALNEGQA